MIALIPFCLLLGNTMAKGVYYMDSSLDCGYIGVQEIPRDQTKTVYAKTTDTSSSSQTGCTINFQTADTDATVRVDFDSFIVNDCDVNLYLSGDAGGQMTKYSCGDNPSMYTTDQRSLTLTLHRTSVTANQYGFKLRIAAVRDKWNGSGPQTNDNLVSSQVGSRLGTVNLIIIIVACIFGAILITLLTYS